jgi:integrase
MREVTFGDLAVAYLTKHLKGKESQGDYAWIYRTYFEEPLGKLPLAQVERFWLMELNQSLADRPAHANKVLGFVKQAFKWGQRTINHETHRPYWEGENPGWSVGRYQCFDRERVMDHAEITLLLQQIEHFDEKYQAFYMTRLLVPCRLRELCTMRRDAVLETGKWTKGKTKNGRPHVIHIPRQAMQYLRRLSPTWFDKHTRTHVPHAYFFPGQYGQPLSPCAVQKMWRRHRAKLDMNDLWLLDFRRTLHTYLYRVMKVDDLTAKALLNHYDARPVAIYVRLDYDYLAGILQGYADWLWQFKQEVSYDASALASQSSLSVPVPSRLQPLPPGGARPDRPGTLVEQPYARTADAVRSGAAEGVGDGPVGVGTDYAALRARV